MRYKKTKHEGITEYYTKKGKRFRVRITFDNHLQEHSKSGFTTISEAQAYKSMMESKLITEGPNVLTGRKRTFGDHWESYKDYKIKQKDWNLNTIEGSQYKIKPFLDAFKETPLTDITSKKVQSVIDGLYEDKEYSQETVESYYRMFKQVLDDAVIDGYLTANRAAKVTTNKDDWQPKNKVISVKQYKEFMALAKEHMREDIFRCLYLLTFGLRRGEAYGIRESSIEFLDKGLSMVTIDTQRTRNYRDGKSVKTKTSNRIVIFDEVATQYLKEQIEYARIIKATHKEILHKDDFIFINPDGTPYPEKTLNDAMHKIAKKMKHPVRVTPHMFRHMFTTTASEDKELNPLSLQTVLGHANLAMTQHYTHGSIEAAKNVMEATRGMRLID